jgi:hypothetical protein
MKFTEFIKDYVKKHPGVKYKDAIKDKKVRCLWHDHRGKEIGCPSSCPPVPQERAQFTTLPRPASIGQPQPVRQYTPPVRQPPVLGRTRNDLTQQQEVHVDADGFATNQLANAISRSYRTTVPPGQSFLSGLMNTVGENLANALEGIREAIPADRGILGDSDSWVGTFNRPEPEPSVVSTPALTLATGYSTEEEFYDTNPAISTVARRRQIYSGPRLPSLPQGGIFYKRPTPTGRLTNKPRPLTQEERDEARGYASDDSQFDDMPGLQDTETVSSENKEKIRMFDLGKETMYDFKTKIEPRLNGTPVSIAEKSNRHLNGFINNVPEKYRGDFVKGLNFGSDNGKLYKIKYIHRTNSYKYTITGSGLRKKKSRKYI